MVQLKGVFKYYTQRGTRLFFRNSDNKKLQITLSDQLPKEEVDRYKKQIFILL